MRAEDLRKYQKAAPFQPFRITMNSGRAFEIRHPEMLYVTVSSVHVYTLNADGIPDKGETIGLGLIESVKELETPASAQSDGQGASP